jgi:glycosyltransferase involved in cell wall biosynthesis
LHQKNNKKLRIVIGSLGRGGAEIHLLRVIPRLIDLGWSVDLLVLKDGGALTDEFKKKGVKIFEPPKYFNILKGRIGRFIRMILWPFWICFHLLRERKSILHFFLPEAYLLGASCALMMLYPEPMLMSRRSLNLYQNKYPLARAFERFLHRRMGMILGNSQRVIDQLYADEGVPKDKLELVYNGLDISEVNDKCAPRELRVALHIQEEAVVMTVVANLIPYKGHADLLQALARVKERLPDHWALLCVGMDNGILVPLEKLAEELGLSEHIHWLGSRSDVAEILAASDIGVLCSHEEGFSNAILEYMAAGLPVIATDVGGNAEAVVDSETGWIVPAHDVLKLSERVVSLVGNAEIRKRFGEAAFLRVRAEFSMDTCIHAYVQCYEALEKK